MRSHLALWLLLLLPGPLGSILSGQNESHVQPRKIGVRGVANTSIRSVVSDRLAERWVEGFDPGEVIAWAIDSANTQTTTPSVETFQSSGKKIRLERFSPGDLGRHPVIFVLYGATGITAGGEALRTYSRSLADHGYMALLIHYFDATDSTTAGKLPVSRHSFQLWTKALHDGISYAAKDPRVDRHRIGLLGFSMGAFLALWESSQDPRVSGVSEYYGGISLFLAPPQRMPATLILHGDADSFVPVEEAYKLERLLEQEHAPHEIKIYPRQEHGFDGPEGNPAAANDAWERTLAFFRKYLGGQ